MMGVIRVDQFVCIVVSVGGFDFQLQQTLHICNKTQLIRQVAHDCALTELVEMMDNCTSSGYL